MDRQDADNTVPPGSTVPPGNTVRPATGLSEQPIARRSLLKGVGSGALAVGAGGLLAACGSGIKGTGGSSSTGTINIGFITPLTGPLAGFASGDNFVLGQIRNSAAYKNGIKIGGKNYKVNIVVMDSQSSPTRAGQVAQQLALQNKVDLILTTSTPETTNPVAAQCEKQRTPCLSTVVPWESWYAGLGGNPLTPTKTFTYCTMFFFGLKEFQGAFVPMWNRIPNNKVVACHVPQRLRRQRVPGGFEPLIKASSYRVVDGGAYTDGTTDFTSMITQFKNKQLRDLQQRPAAARLQHVLEAGRLSRASSPSWRRWPRCCCSRADTTALGNLVVQHRHGLPGGDPSCRTRPR